MGRLIIGAAVFLEITDPWDFVTNNGDNREGVIQQFWGPKKCPTVVAIKLMSSVCNGDFCISLVYAYGRHSDGLVGLVRGNTVSCNFSEKFDAISAPAGEIAFLGSLRLN